MSETLAKKCSIHIEITFNNNTVRLIASNHNRLNKYILILYRINATGDLHPELFMLIVYRCLDFVFNEALLSFPNL